MHDSLIKGNAARMVADRMNNSLDATPQQREAMLWQHDEMGLSPRPPFLQPSP